MRVVLDTNILVRATKSAQGPAREILRHLQSQDHLLVLSNHILSEVLRVLHYPRVKALHGLSSDESQQFVKSLHDDAEVVVVQRDPTQAISHDPDDDPVIQTAIQGSADVLCSLDRHLRHQQVCDYCQQHDIQIMTDLELLSVLKGGENPTNEQG